MDLKDADFHIQIASIPQTILEIALLPQVIRQVREVKRSALLVAPLWRKQVWFPKLIQLSSTAPWPIPLGKVLLSQVKGMIWHPRPELWRLHVWLLNVLQCPKGVEWPPPGHGPVEFLLVRFVRPLPDHRRLPLPDSITWTSLPCRPGKPVCLRYPITRW